MEKYIKHLLSVIIFFVFTSNVSAENINPSDIENNSYVIGNYVYTSNTVLSTRHIMLAAKTINGDKTDDMIIYYKTPRGKWIEGLSGESIPVPDTFNVEYIDNTEYSGQNNLDNITIECNSSNIENNAYVIGSYIFSSDTVLSTRHIMLAAKTITGNKIDDMIIYYKTPRGKWIEGLSGDAITPSEIFEISHTNTKTIPVVTFNANGGSVDVNDKHALKGTAYGELPTPTRKNYTFDGWYTEKENGTKIESTTEYAYTSDSTLYAHWVSIPTLPSWIDSAHFKNQGISMSSIRCIIFQDKIDIPSDAIKSWDISANQENDVVAYFLKCNDWGYCLYIQSDTQLYANEDMSSWFSGLKNLEKVRGLELVNTNNVIKMNKMFYQTGYGSENLSLDISTLNTSNVTDMSYMFYEMGYEDEDFSLDISNFDTSNVTNMSYMFYETGYNSGSFALDLSKFNTSNVTNMSYMFYKTGYNNSSFALDLSNFDTSNVTNMSHMFDSTGCKSSNFTLNISNFNTSNVTDMSYMFNETGRNKTIFKLDLSNFDTSNVTNMSHMFSYTGYDSDNLIIDLSSFDTSNVTDMSYMFDNTGRNNTTLTLDVSNLDTSNVTNMSNMFSETGKSDEAFTLDVSNFNTSNVTNMSRMFYDAGLGSVNFTLDVSNFDTSKVTDMSYMFAYAGLSNDSFTLDVSNFDTSNVTDMRGMFAYTGATSEVLTLDLRNFDTSNVTNMSGMFHGTAWRWSWLKFELYLGDNFDTSNVTDMTDMFNATGLSNTITITIRNSNVSEYKDMFKDVATKTGSQITVNYTSETSELVDNMIATKSANSNVVKGVRVD